MVSLDTYRSDRYYSKVVQAFSEILTDKVVVEPIEVFMAIGVLSNQGYEDWRFGRIPHLERAIQCGLPRCRRILKIIGFHANDLDMVPCAKAYKKWGKGRKVDLQFSKNGDPYLEKRYARNFKWNRKLSYAEYFEAKNIPDQGAAKIAG